MNNNKSQENMTQHFYLRTDNDEQLNKPVGVVAFAYAPVKSKYANKNVFVAGSMVSYLDNFEKQKGSNRALARLNQAIANGAPHEKCIIIPLRTFKSIKTEDLICRLGLLSGSNHSLFTNWNKADQTKKDALRCLDEKMELLVPLKKVGCRPTSVIS